MKKQILFATGGTHRADGVVALTPADKAALAVATVVSKHSTSKKNNQRYRGRSGYYACLNNANGITKAQADALGNLCKKLSPYIGDYGLENGYFTLYTTSSYRFYGADMLEGMRKLYSQISGLPATVDDDQYIATNGRVEIVQCPNISLKLEYKIPFDYDAYQARHQKQNETDTADAETKKKQAEADQAEADAQKAAQKAKLMKTLRVALIALAVVAVVVVLALIIKKK